MARVKSFGCRIARMQTRQRLVLAAAALFATSILAQDALFDAPVRNPGQKQLCNPCIDPPVNHSGPGSHIDDVRRRMIITREGMRSNGVISLRDLLNRISDQGTALTPGQSGQCVTTDVVAGPAFQFDDADESSGGDTAWYGTQSFAVLLKTDPVYGIGDKFFWYSAGFRPEQAADLNVTIRRVGEGATTAFALAPTNALFDDRWHMLTGINFPDAGCWEINGEYHGQQLTVVVESVDP